MSDYKKELLDRTMSRVGVSYENWKTENDQMNTRLILDDTSYNALFTLDENEEPLLESRSGNAITLITTQRVMVLQEDTVREMSIDAIHAFGKSQEEVEDQSSSGARTAKTTRIELIGNDNEILTFTIDSIHPAYFARWLIINLIKDQV